MNRLADSIILLWGWRRLLLAFLAGAATVLGLAPFDLWPIAFLTIPVLVWLLDGASGAQGAGFIRRLWPAFLIGWAFGFGYFAAGLWWIGTSFLVEAETFAWLLPAAVVLFPAALAILWGLGAAFARVFWSDGWTRLLALAAAMTAVEWLRGHILTGFPWNAFGYTLLADPRLLQLASLVGLWGVTLLAFVVFAAPALLAGTGRGRFVALAGILLVLVADAGYGWWRLQGAEGATVAGVRLRIVQAGLAQDVKQDPDRAAANFAAHINLSSQSAFDPAVQTLVIWPETAVPYILTEEPQALFAIAGMLPPGASLVTGAPRLEPATAATDERIYNSVLVINDQGSIIDSYDKVHLVPFGEYLPLSSLFDRIGLRQLISLPGGFAAGMERRLLSVPGIPSFSPMVCYETIFPAEVVPEGQRPGWLLNVTNDGWFGDSTGPHQHFRQAMVRAVEEGLPLVRAANTGISGIVDPYGRILAIIVLGEAGVVDGGLPASLEPTIYALYGDWPAVVLAFLALVVGVGGWFTMARRR